MTIITHPLIFFIYIRTKLYFDKFAIIYNPSYCFIGATQEMDSILPIYIAPINDPPICSVKQPQRTSLQECNNNKPCMFDYTAIGNREIALKSKAMSMRIHELRRFLAPGKYFFG